MKDFGLSKIVIRSIKESDLDSIVEIEEKNLGLKRKGYWQRELKKTKKGVIWVPL